MPGDKPPRPQVNPIRTSLVDSGWEAAPPAPREPVESITEVDDLLEDVEAPPPPVAARLPPVPLPPPRMPAPPVEPVMYEAHAPPEPAAYAPPEPAPAPYVPPPPAAFAPPEPAAYVPAEPAAYAPPEPAAYAAPEPAVYAPPSQQAAYAPLDSPPSSRTAPARKSSMPVVALVVAGVGAVVFGIVGFLVGRSEHTPAAAPMASVATAPVSASAAPEPSAAPPPPPPVPTTELEKAAAGDHDALATLDARDPAVRSVEEALALSAGQASERHHELDALAAEVEKDPAKLADHDVRDKLVKFARDLETYRDAQKIIAALPGADGPDILYEVWTGTTKHTPATELAESLVQAKGVREHASPALSLALDLRAPESCAVAKKLLASAPATGDRRSVHLLLRLVSKRGCGPAKRDDCYPCLRADKNAIIDAVKAVRDKPGPKF